MGGISGALQSSLRMPIIRSEISCHPADLLTKLPEQMPPRCWLVVQTFARQEKSLARDLLERDVPFYLPLKQRRLDYRGRKVVSYIPFFSGVLFCYANEAERVKCLETRRVVSVVEVPQQSEFPNELRRIAKAISEDKQGGMPDNGWLVRDFQRLQMSKSALQLSRNP